jgi:hypothetical protein
MFSSSLLLNRIDMDWRKDVIEKYAIDNPPLNALAAGFCGCPVF